MVTTERLAGRIIIGFDAGEFVDADGHIGHRPRIFLDDGSHLFFAVEQTTAGPGVRVSKSRHTKRDRARRAQAARLGHMRRKGPVRADGTRDEDNAEQAAPPGDTATGGQ